MLGSYGPLFTSARARRLVATSLLAFLAGCATTAAAAAFVIARRSTID